MVYRWNPRPDPGQSDWRASAACLDEDPELFFSDGEHGRSTNQLEIARRVCMRCPAQPHCLEVALATGARHGMWGGTTPDERRSMQRRNQTTWTFAEPEEIELPAAVVRSVVQASPPPTSIPAEIPAGDGSSWQDALESLRGWVDARREGTRA